MTEAVLSLSDRSSLLEGQNRALQLANAGAPIGEVLDLLVSSAQSHSDGSFLGSILLLDQDGKHLRHGAAPSLPPAYNAAIDGVAIGPAVGSCGTAAHFGHAIVVTDIERDPLWADFRDLALANGLRACWSTPFLAKDGAVLGTLALYYREPRCPTERDRAIVEVICNAAAMVLENARLQARLRDLQDRAQLAATTSRLGYFTWEISSDTVTWQNDQPYEIFGIPRSDPPINAQRFVAEFLHPEDQSAFAEAVSKALDGGSIFRFQGRIRRKLDGELRWVEVTGQLDTSRGKRHARVIGITADVTARQPAVQTT